jgi:hypothetical protein
MKDIYLIRTFITAVLVLVAGALGRALSYHDVGDLLTFSAFCLIGINLLLLCWSYRHLILRKIRD